MVRPKLKLCPHKRLSMRQPDGVAVKENRDIYTDDDVLTYKWKLIWHIKLEIWNNSTQSAYEISFEHRNLPYETYIDDNIGSIEPISSNNKKDLNIKVIKDYFGLPFEADQYLKKETNEIMEDCQTIVRYKDEYGTKYSTFYGWSQNSNRLRLLW
jgi:hypothetical protein